MTGQNPVVLQIASIWLISPIIYPARCNHCPKDSFVSIFVDMKETDCASLVRIRGPFKKNTEHKFCTGFIVQWDEFLSRKYLRCWKSISSTKHKTESNLCSYNVIAKCGMMKVNASEMPRGAGAALTPCATESNTAQPKQIWLKWGQTEVTKWKNKVTFNTLAGHGNVKKCDMTHLKWCVALKRA